MSALGIDIGTSSTQVCQRQGDVVWDAPTVMTVRRDSTRGRIVPAMIGHEAWTLIGRCPVELATAHPVRDGAIVDLEAARAYLAAVLSEVCGPRWARVHTRAVLAVPAGATGLERRGLLEAADDAGVFRPRLVPGPLAGAVGCGIDPFDRRAHMVVDVGGGTAEALAFCYGGVLAMRSSRVAGDELDLALSQYLRDEHQLLVGDLAAEDIKWQVSGNPDPSLLVYGLDASAGRPRLVTLAATEVLDVLRPTVDGMVATLAGCLDQLPLQVIDDILRQGVCLFGGGAFLRGFDKLLQDALGFPIWLPERPLTCVAEGAASCLDRSALLSTFDGQLSDLT